MRRIIQSNEKPSVVTQDIQNQNSAAANLKLKYNDMKERCNFQAEEITKLTS